MLNDIFNGEIYTQSQCLQREHVIKNFLNDLLDNYGFSAADQLGRIMKKESQTAIVCLVDDFNVCGAALNRAPEHWFDSNTIVLTDNRVLFNPAYTILELPVSFYSTFSYTPKLNQWVPTRDFHLPINRGDNQRLAFFKEFCSVRGFTDADYVNYNTAHDGQEPVRNHKCYIEQAFMQSWLNLVIETYAGNQTITFSEKTFRALQTPAPWMLYACTGSINYLRSIGFDVLDDLIDHGYDPVQQTGKHGIDKIKVWIEHGLKNLSTIKNLDIERVQQRCNRAAEHNRNLLKNWKRSWPGDFATWLSNTVKVLDNYS